MSNESTVKPFVPAHRSLPEITVKGVVLAIILTIILGASNCYLSLSVGMTVSASIPAAVISMGVLRFFKHSNILENNIVQTCASMGEATTSGLAFILPALLILHYWMGFYYWQTATITLIAGFLGVLFGIPIRRVMLNDPTLRFPEGTAIGEVLKASANSAANMIYLVMGGLIGAVISLCQSGFGLFASSFSYYVARGSAVYGFGWGYSPALIAAGYIVGPIVAVSMFSGVVISWVIGVPVLSHIYGIPAAADLGQAIWSDHLRYIGVGTMLIGGLWRVVTLMKQIYLGIKASLQSIKANKGLSDIPRTERDMPINLVFWILLVMFCCVTAFIYYQIDPKALGVSMTTTWVISLVGALFVVFVGFILCSVSGYFAGLVGATNNPASGLMVSGLLIMSLILLLILVVAGVDIAGHKRVVAAAIAILILTMLASGLTITADTIQDLKAGQIVGATPWKQQVMLVLGCIISAFVLPFILQLLFNAYGIGGVFPRPDMDPTKMLSAPQAGLMAAIAKGVFFHNLPWAMIITGAIIAAVAVVIDEFLKRTSPYRFPVLAVGIGIYLPLEMSMAVVVGGFLAFLVHRGTLRLKDKKKASMEGLSESQHNGLLMACGIVAGATIMGVLLAIPFAIFKSSTVLEFVSPSHTVLTNVLSIIVTLGMCVMIYKIVCKRAS